MASWPPNVVSTIIYLAPSEASSHSTHSKKVETKQKSEPKGSKMCFSRPNYKWASAMTTGQVLSHITAISCFVSVLGWKKCVSPPIALLRWKPCWFGSLIYMVQDYCLSFGRKCPFSKGMLHLLKDASIICRGIACWKKHLILSKDNCKRMTKASLQAGEASLLYLIYFNITSRTGIQCVNSCYILQKHISPAKEGCTSREILHFGETHVIFCKG